MIIAGEGKVKEVCIYFGGLLLRGNRASKYSASGMQAFESPNYPQLAKAGIAIRYNEAALLKKTKTDFELKPFKDVEIGVIRIFPGIRFDLFDEILTGKLKGVVIETFGSGNIPDDGGVLFLGDVASHFYHVAVEVEHVEVGEFVRGVLCEPGPGC